MSITTSTLAEQQHARRADHGPRGAVMATVTDPPSLRPGIELIGGMPDTGFTDPQWLIQRDGRFIQVSRLLYRVTEQIDGHRSLAQIANAVTESPEWLVTDQVVRQLIAKLVPLGMVAPADGSDGGMASRTRREARSTLQIRARVRTLGPR